MRKTGLIRLAVFLIALSMLASCTGAPAQESAEVSESLEVTESPKASQGQIYLYGEIHAVKELEDKEFELWYDFYHNEGMRHLFIESPYYFAEFLNIWMQSDSDEILDRLHEDMVPADGYSTTFKEFYQKIKSECPETIFHGTDVGHLASSTGVRYSKYIAMNDLKDTETHLLTQEALKQGGIFKVEGDVYRENTMAENFIREFDKLEGESVMGIYGAAHTGLDDMNYTGEVPSMANQLREHYGEIVHSEDLSLLLMPKGAIRIDTVTVPVVSKKYMAPYFGELDLSIDGGEYATYGLWRLEDAYEDFKDAPETGVTLPCDAYPMKIEPGQVFLIAIQGEDDVLEMHFFRFDGESPDGIPVTVEFEIG